MLSLLNNLFALGVIFLMWLYIFKLFMRKNELLLKTIRIFLILHLILVAFMLTEQHRFTANMANSIFMDDGEIYSSNAWQISTALTGNIPDIRSVGEMRGIHLADRGWGLERYYREYINKKIIPPAGEYHIRYITYLYSAIYAAYGFKPALINFLNVILHLLTAIIIYKAVTLVFDDKAAYLSCLFFLLNPITFYYSSTKLQESAGMFFTYLAIYCFIAFLKKNNYWYALSIFPIFYIINSFLKTYYFIPLLLVFAVSFAITLFVKKKKLFFVLSIVIFFSLGISHLNIPKMIKYHAMKALQDSVTHQKGFYNTGGQVYRIFIPDKESWNYTPADWAGYVSRGWYHMLSEPVLSPERSAKLLLFFPFKVIFLILCAFALPGILMAIRYGHFEAVIFIGIIVILGTGISMSSGNVGTMLRHRDIITPAIFTFSAFYISRLFFGGTPARMKKE